VYDERYAHDVAELEFAAGCARDEKKEKRGGAGGDDADDADAIIEAALAPRPFPEYVLAHCARRYGVKSLAEKAAWELMCNAEAARSAGAHTSVDLFCAFCNRGYDDEELMFFLYVRQARRPASSDRRAVRAGGSPFFPRGPPIVRRFRDPPARAPSRPR
jgi:hypothetical protein